MSKGKEHVCVSLDDELLRVIQIKGSGSSAKVTNIVTRSTQGVSDQELPRLVQSALTGFNIKSSNISLIAPANSITTKNIEVPSKNADEIKSIVNLQASRHTPYSKDEIQVGYVNIGLSQGSYTKVLLVIANKYVLKSQLAVLEGAGAKVRNIFFSAEGVASLYSGILNLKKKSAPHAVIDIGKLSTNFVIVSEGKAIASRNIPVGRKQLTDDGEVARGQLFEELKNTVETYKAEGVEQAPSTFVLTADDDINKFVERNITEQLGWEVKIVPYLNRIKASKALLNKIAQEIKDTSFLDLIAAVITYTKGSINLMPEEVQLQKFIKDQTKEIFKALVLVLIILFLIAGAFTVKWYFRNVALNQVNGEYEKFHQEVSVLKAKADKIKIINDFLDKRMLSLDVVYELYLKIPKDVYLTGIQMVDENTLSIQGISETASKVYKLRTMLQESELFESVEVKSQSARKDRGKDVAGFEMDISLQK